MRIASVAALTALLMTSSALLSEPALAASRRAPVVQPPANPLPDSVVRQAEVLRDKALAGSGAYEILESLTTEIGPRPAGSDAEHRAAAWGVARLKALGFTNVHTESFPVPGWTRGEEKAEVVAPYPQRLLVTALGGSVATPAEGLEAEIVVFKTFEDLLAAAPGSLTGKIAVVTQPMPRTQDGSGYGANYRIRGLGASEAAKRGAVAYLLRSLATGDRRDPHTGTMTYAEDAPKIPAAALSVTDAEQLDRMVARGQPVKLKLTLTPTLRQNATAETVVGDILGREKPDEIVLIGGHLDSWDLGTGAIDDGSGIAITTATAKLIADLPTRPRRTIRVAMFGAEEIGKAAEAFAAAHEKEQGQFIIASESDFGAEPIYAMQLPANGLESPYGRALAKVVAPLSVTIVPGAALDAGADLEALKGVPLAGLSQDGSHYFDLHHTADDTLDKVSRTSLDKAVASWVSFVYLAADTDTDFRALAAPKAGKPGAK
jgi:Zn-dependent M28 family amino/carboxypeptidase